MTLSRSWIPRPAGEWCGECMEPEAHSIINGRSGQSNQTFFREGKRNLGLWLMDEVLQAKPEQYLLMQKEHYIEEDSND